MLRRLPLIAMLLFAAPAWAADGDAQLWLRASASGSLSGPWQGSLDMVLRYGDEAEGLYEAEFGGSLGYQFKSGIALFGGYLRVPSYSRTGVTRTESRFRQQVNLPLGTPGGGKLSGRLRIEQRLVSTGNKLGVRLRPNLIWSRPLRKGGKTSLVKLLVGLLRPDAGEIWVDGYPLSLLQLRAFRRQVGVVMQDDVLLSGTLADNIAFFDPAADQEKVQACAAAASLHDDIMRMPMGYRTLVGDMGSTLSVGQRQRLFLARALYHDPKILIVDEGTANLDRESEGRVIDHLATLPITRIIVAHRPRAFSIADRFFAVIHGNVVELDRDQVGKAEPQVAAPPPAASGDDNLQAAE